MISETLISWYKINKRDLPWRETTNPYFIWLSEIILQQTRVNQGLAYYHEFISRFPTVKDLANASEEKILKTWQGLGYYSRARNLHSAARTICDDWNQQIPGDYQKILSLKGVGQYTAAAIASFAFNLPYPVADGNVQRVISRLFGILDEVDGSKGKKQVDRALNEIFPEKHPGLFNQAIMEFGALQCVPKNPDCGVCPLNKVCIANRQDLTKELPRKLPKRKPVDKFIHFLHISDGHSVAFEKRSGKGIWKNLYQFPAIETDNAEEPEVLFETTEWKKIFGDKNYSVTGISDSVIHKLSHQNIHARFYKIKSDKKSMKQFPVIPLNEIENYPVPRLIENYILGNF